MRQAVRVAFVAAVLSLSPAASAQPRFEASAGAHFAYRQPEPIKRDWLVAGGFRINQKFDHVVEVAWHRRRDIRLITDAEDRLTGVRGGTDRYVQIASGIRGRLTQEQRFTPFYQGLVGLFTFSPTRHPKYRNRLDVLSPWDGSGTLFLLQPGAGLDVAIRPGLKVRFATDLMMLVDEGFLHNTPRASVRLAVQF
ncbi:MAG: hypothetical protein OXG35_22785 [Acidobacteria bacterium]|nr:hypothetical protein [Acidobacteriota bacterium]